MLHQPIILIRCTINGMYIRTFTFPTFHINVVANTGICICIDKTSSDSFLSPIQLEIHLLALKNHRILTVNVGNLHKHMYNIYMKRERAR